MIIPIIVNSVAIIVALFIILKSADYLIYGVREYSNKIGLTGSASGFIIVSMAGSMTEIFSAVSGLFSGSEGVVFGTIIGNNLVHFAVLMGLVFFFSRDISLENPVLENSLWLVSILFFLPFILMVDGYLGRIDGVILLTGFIFFIGKIWYDEKSEGIKENLKLKEIWKESTIFVLALIGVLIGARLLVVSSLQLSIIMRIPAYLVSLIVIGFGATIDDFSVVLGSLLGGEEEIGMGDAIGSAMNELLLFFGLVGIIKPISIPINDIWIGATFLIGVVAISLFLLYTKKAKRWHGIGLMMIYVIYLVIEISKAT